jgi:NAD(P)-dependent dehydrogenase (short-subunit alcohol dehydrogenase family)
MTTIYFTGEDLNLFSSASHDRNPLHLSEDYARHTPYGSRVIFGILDGLVAIGHVADRPGFLLSSVEFEFFDTALLGIDYSVEVSDSGPAEATVRVVDGRRPVLEAVLAFRLGTRRDPVPNGVSSPFRSEAMDLTTADLPVGRRARGEYAPAQGDFEALCARAHLKQSWADPLHLASLLWGSYLVGMELPGKRALFSRLVIEFSESARPAMPFKYQAEITEINEMGELTITGFLSSGGAKWANFTIGAFVREDLPPVTTAKVENMIGRSHKLNGKVALVTGASRGLGASLVRALALQGCTVLLNFLRSHSEAEGLRDSLADTPGRVVLLPGNVADLHWCTETQQHVASEFGRLDFLVCNACPPLLPLWLEAPAAERVNDFIQNSLAMVSAPMMAFLPMLAQSKGWNVVISSSAVEQLHPYFPHYVVGKTAAEALARAASTEYRSISSLILRPPRLLTDLTNSPLGRKGAVPPQEVAVAVVNRLLAAPVPGKVEVLNQFSVAVSAQGKLASNV